MDLFAQPQNAGEKLIKNLHRRENGRFNRLSNTGLRETEKENDFSTVQVWTIVPAKRMLKVKDTLRATVNLTFDGRVIKVYHGPKAEERFTNEVRILKHLKTHGCTFVPQLLEAEQEKLKIITSNCGARVEHLDAERLRELFLELEAYGVRHDDPEIRNVTYRQSDGRFCIIDFEFAEILPGWK